MYDKAIIEYNGKKLFVAFDDARSSRAFSDIQWQFKCTACGWKYSAKNRYIERMYDHWRFSHKTKFTFFALMGVGKFDIIPMYNGNEQRLVIGAYV
jgi:hypothetical protein